MKRVTIAALAVMFTCAGPALTANAATPVTSETNTATSATDSTARFSQTNDGSGVRINLSPGAQFREADDGTVAIVDDEGKVVDSLPETAIDENGDEIRFVYSLQGTHSVNVYPSAPNGITPYGWWDSWGRCVAGTAGGAGGGALAGAVAGSELPVIGNAAGGVIGGVSGGLTGAAASC